MIHEDISPAMTTSACTLEVSAIVPVTERFEEVVSVGTKYVQALRALNRSFEVIFAMDGDYPDISTSLAALRDEYPEITLLKLPRTFGEATAIMIAAGKAQGRLLLTLPAYEQIDLSKLSLLFDGLGDSDMVVACRGPRQDSWINRLQTTVFSKTVSRISGLKLNDAGCSVRLFRRGVLDEVQLYGDFHRFLPVLAHQKGFRVVEVEVPQAESDTKARIYRPGLYLRRMLDLLSIFVLLRFTKKPFRFFGLIGSAALILGVLISAVVIGEKIFGGQPLADRPLFIMGSLLIVFGLQIFAVGLIGELIIFTHAHELKEYSVGRIVERSAASDQPERAASTDQISSPRNE